ncbi:YihY/virulence factor BrkB family protein [Cytobacillus purgationiresistens]|uniref:Membrane protein n=1 Tax=Cytobacillus purgationiresistens TaxID=863449 RepID=A0ABU0AJX6_9BACI|nr:YihY/virulence factor BrkB family protein [Cytobacillus purgationiresistens]MDQ0271558.1 membrane protein [Cytobacillus purgationiresistens]
MEKAVGFGKELWNRVQKDDVFGIAAQLAYFFLLSLFPLLIVLISVLPYLPITQEDIFGIVRDFAPKETMSLIENNLNEMSTRNGTLLSFGVLATLWSASNGINGIVRAFNRAYDVPESRSFLVARGVAILLTISMIFVFVVALLLPVFGKQIGLLLFNGLGLSDEFLSLWNMLRWLASPMIIFLIFSGLYWFAPNKKLTKVTVLPGSIFATVGWIVASYAFSYYVSNFANYSATYGSIGAIIILMIWFYLSGIIIMIGGEINAMINKSKKAHAE